MILILTLAKDIFLMQQLKLDFKRGRFINIGWELADLYNEDLSKHMVLIHEPHFFNLRGGR